MLLADWTHLKLAFLGPLLAPTGKVDAVEDRHQTQRPQPNIAKRDAPFARLQTDMANADRFQIAMCERDSINKWWIIDPHHERAVFDMDMKSMPLIGGREFLRFHRNFFALHQTASGKWVVGRGNIQLVAVFRRI